MFIFLERDAFAGVTRTASSDRKAINEGKGINAVRRPYRGIQIKEDTYSSISIRRSNGNVIPLTSSSARWKDNESTRGIVRDYSDYILQSVVEQRVEKQQIIETFGDSFIYFFGERPRLVTITGLLINTEDFNWRSQFWHNYNRYMRGTQLVRANARCYLAYDTIVLEGYPIQAQATDDSNQPYSVPFSMTMFLTNYYDYSDIGVTRFPEGGRFNQTAVDAANLELEKWRNRYTPTTGEVRKKNLEAFNSAGGLFDTLRGGIRAVNDALSWVGDISKGVQNILGGRTVRLPIGVAGFIQATGNPVIGQGGLGSSTILSNEGLGSYYDPTTGTFKTLTGSVRLRMPGSSGFAPAWTSSVYEGKPRGEIWENYDEYPYQERNQPYDFLNPESLNSAFKRVEDLLPAAEKQAYLDRWSARWEAVETQKSSLLYWNYMAEGGDLLSSIGDAISEGVAFAKSNFGLVMTAAAFINDPLGVTQAALGIGVGTQSSSRIAGRRDQLEAQGIRVSPKAGAGGIEGYIGAKALETFKNMGQRFEEEYLGGSGPPSDPTDEFAIGGAYNSGPYKSPGAGTAVNVDEAYAPSTYENRDAGTEVDYEQVYGDNDYTTTIEQAEAVSPEEALAGEEAGFSETEVAASINEVYGGTDNEGEGPPPSALDEVYGTGESSTSVRTPAQIAAILAAAQSSGGVDDPQNDSIQGVESEDSAIDPVV